MLVTSSPIFVANTKIIFNYNFVAPLRADCNSKNQLINLILESVFKSDILKVTSYTNSNTLLTTNDDYQFPKRFSKNKHQKSSYNSYTHDNRFHSLSVNEDSQNNNEDLTSQSHQVKYYILKYYDHC